MRLTKRVRQDERGAALITALLCTMVMLALGLALLAVVDTQAGESSNERTRDRAFNLSESVLTSEAFVLGRNWPTPIVGGYPACSAAEFGAAIDDSAAAAAAAERLRPNLNASYTDDAYSAAPWRARVCDDDILGTTVWSDAVLANQSGDANGNGKVWVRAQSTVDGRTRAVVGLVSVREIAAVNPRFGLVAGSFSDDLGPATSAITNAAVLSDLKLGLLTTYPPVAPDPDNPVPASGVTGLRCGLLNQATEVKTCVTGAMAGLSALPAFDTLVTGRTYEQYPSVSSTDEDTIGQLRKQATDASTYVPTTSGDNNPDNAPLCSLPAGAGANTVVFFERVGNGDQYCYIDVGLLKSKAYKALVIGRGRVVIRGSGTITNYESAPESNRFTGVVYALNLQTADHSLATPTKELVRIEKGARVTGAVHADGKNAKVALIAPDFDASALVDALIPCTDIATCALRVTLKALGVPALITRLTSGTCLLDSILGCVVQAPSVASVVGNITSQLTTYGSAIHSDVDVIKALEVYGASGVTPGTFRDLTPR